MNYTNLSELLNSFNAKNTKDLVSKLDLLTSGTGLYECVLANNEVKSLESLTGNENIKEIQFHVLSEGSESTFKAGCLMFPFSETDLNNCIEKMIFANETVSSLIHEVSLESRLIDKLEDLAYQNAVDTFAIAHLNTIGESESESLIMNA